MVGGLTISAAHGSHWKRCRSVPQIEAASIFSSTSPGPGTGNGRCTSSRPGSGRRLGERAHRARRGRGGGHRGQYRRRVRGSVLAEVGPRTRSQQPDDEHDADHQADRDEERLPARRRLGREVEQDRWQARPGSARPGWRSRSRSDGRSACAACATVIPKRSAASSSIMKMPSRLNGARSLKSTNSMMRGSSMPVIASREKAQANQSRTDQGASRIGSGC